MTCTLADKLLTLAPDGSTRPLPAAAVIATPSLVPFFAKTGTAFSEMIGAAPQAVSAADGSWTLNLPWPSQSDPGSVSWNIALPDGATWSGTIPEGVTGPLTLYQLKTTYGWVAVQAPPSLPAPQLPATTAILGTVLLDTNPLSGSPIALTRAGYPNGAVQLSPVGAQTGAINVSGTIAAGGAITAGAGLVLTGILSGPGTISIGGGVFSSGGSESATTNLSSPALHTFTALPTTLIANTGAVGADLLMAITNPISSPNTNLAASFLAPGTTLGQITVQMKTSATWPTGPAFGVALYADSGGVPPVVTYGANGNPNNALAIGQALAYNKELAFQSPAVAGTGYGTVVLGLKYGALIPGNKYWLVFYAYRSGTSTGNLYLLGNTTGAASAFFDTTGAGVWIAGAGTVNLTVQGQTPPAIAASSPNGIAITASSTTQPAVQGISTNNSGLVGISTSNPGIQGISTDDVGITATSTNSYGLSATSTTVTGLVGLTGAAAGPTAIYGLFGGATSAGGATAGVGGTGAGTAQGVAGSSTSGAGVAGTSSTGFALQGVSTTGVAGYFQTGGTSGKQSQLLLATGGTVGPPSLAVAHSQGEIYVDSHAVLWICTGAGTPGTWKQMLVTDPAAGSTPTAAAATGSAVTAVSVGSGSTNARGTVTFTTSAAPVAGAQVDLTWGGSPIATAPLAVLLSWNTSGTVLAAQECQAINLGTTRVTLAVPAALAASTTFTAAWAATW